MTFWHGRCVRPRSPRPLAILRHNAAGRPKEVLPVAVSECPTMQDLSFVGNIATRADAAAAGNGPQRLQTRLAM
jgi:hypothetical protein